MTKTLQLLKVFNIGFEALLLIINSMIWGWYQKMEIYKSPFWEAFNSRTDLEKYGVDALLLFTLQLRFSIEDIGLVASTSLTEGGDDKKADLVYIDSETGYAIIAQTYIAIKITGKNGELKKGAPSNKASDLNTAISWLLARSINEVPENLRPHAELTLPPKTVTL